jgi:hypothetical protein
MDKAAAATLPGLFREGKLIAAPLDMAAGEGAPIERLEAECLVGSRLGINVGEGTAGS